MVEFVEAGAGAARLVLAPSFGGAITRLDVGGRPVLRPFAGDADDPFSVASNILVPFSNRISGGGFEHDGGRFDVPANLAGEPCPIHGDGFQRHWDANAREGWLILDLPHGQIGPWRYAARQTFELTAEFLRITLNVINRADRSLPYGGGFHPWFPRSAETRLCFDAQAVWMEDAAHLPTERRSLNEAQRWSFSTLRSLPGDWINNGYEGWERGAWISQGEDAVSCKISASRLLTCAIVYSPDASANFFCFEPVSHPVDAHNLETRPGLVMLESGAEMELSVQLSWPDFDG